MILSLYRTLTQIGSPLIRLYLKKRLARGKEDPNRFSERLGEASIQRPAGKLIWMHGASVGESLSLLSLIDKLQDHSPKISILVTTGTVTSAELMAKRLPDGTMHQFIPVDRPAYVRRFLDHWQPDLAIWAESELWPNLIMEAKSRALPMALVNARMSEKSLATWRKFPASIAKLLSAFDLCCAQTDEDAQRYRTLGSKNVQSLGNLKYAAKPLPVDEDDLHQLTSAIDTRPLWFAASTHPGDEMLCARIHAQLKADIPGLLTIIAPRHPERGEEIAGEIAAQNLSVAQRSKMQKIAPDSDVYLADTLGEMGLFFSLSPIVFIGKSMGKPGGGQNPLEPARLNCALISGRHMFNFQEISDELVQKDALRIAHNEDHLTSLLKELLGNPDETVKMAKRAKQAGEEKTSVLDRVLAALQPMLSPLEDKS